MRSPDERHNHVAVGGLVEHDLRVAGGDDLRSLLLRGLGQQPVRLTLTQDLEVGVGLVQQEHGAGVGVQMCQQQKRLLEAPP